MKTSQYQARQPDERGVVHYLDAENQVWNSLITRQMAVIPGRACEDFLLGLERLRLPTDHVPQLAEVNKVLLAATGWRVVPVAALIPFQTFFELLSRQCFPVATFIRTPEDLDYLQEPDIFHEIFGHCPLLTNPWFAKFTQHYGELGLAATKEERAFLARLYWMTVEFGLLEDQQGLRIYGGGILSSPRETLYCLSEVPEHLPFNPLEIMRTPYRIDILQPVYFVLPNLKCLFELRDQDTMALVRHAMQLGLHPAKFPSKQADSAI